MASKRSDPQPPVAAYVILGAIFDFMAIVDALPQSYDILAERKRKKKRDMSPVKAPSNLPDLVRSTFNKAKANGDVNFYPTQVAVLTTASTPVSLPLSALRPALLLQGFVRRFRLSSLDPEGHREFS